MSHSWQDKLEKSLPGFDHEQRALDILRISFEGKTFWIDFENTYLNTFRFLDNAFSDPLQKEEVFEILEKLQKDLMENIFQPGGE